MRKYWLLALVTLAVVGCGDDVDDVTVGGNPPPRDFTEGSPDLTGVPLADLATTPEGPADLAPPPPPPDMTTPPPPDMTTPPPPPPPPPPAEGPVIVPRTNINASQAPGAQTGADLAIDPTDLPYLNHLVGAANDATTGHVVVYETNNGATTWRTYRLPAAPGPYTSASRHPTVAYDSLGNGFVSLIALDTGGNGRAAVARRLAGADGWSAPVLASSNGAERARVTADRIPASPRRDAVYVAWSSGTHVYVASSTNNGASFGGATQVDDDGVSVTSPYPTVAADGTLYVAWLDVTRRQLRIDRSTDGGATWGGDRVIQQLAVSGAAASTIASPQAGASNAPFCDVDRSTGARRGTIYCTFHDLAAGNGLDIFLRRSSDGGANWTAPVRLNDDPAGVAADQFLPRLMVDDRNAKVSVGWYDTRDDAAHVQTNVYFTRANDGVAFVSPVRVTTALSDMSRPGASPEGYGESMGMECLWGRCRVLWTDTRTGSEDLNSAIIDFGHIEFIFSTATVTMPAGGSAQMTVTIRAVNNFNSPVTLSFLNMPSGASGSFSVNPVPPNGSSTVTVNAGGAAPGTYTPSIRAVGGGESHSRVLNMVIQ
jgi:hypothetical protein